MRRRMRMRGMRRGMRFRRRMMFGPRMFWPMMWRPFFWWPRMYLMGSFLFFLFGSNLYKMPRDRVTVIEREAGKPAPDLTEEELVAAMKKLGITRLEVTPDERDAIKRA
jgi:hypothetical protein